MNIQQRIDEAIMLAEMRHGITKRTKFNLYLGREDWSELQDSINGQPFRIVHEVTASTRPIWCGCPIFIVDDESHLSVAPSNIKEDP